MNPTDHKTYRLEVSDLKLIFQNLATSGYQNIGPIARDGAIMLEQIDTFDELAVGYQEKQEKGKYTLLQSNDSSYFEYTLGPQSFKQFLHPPKRKLWEAHGSKSDFKLSYPPLPGSMAFWGVRNCDLQAIEILDKIYLRGDVINEWYKAAREQLFMIAVGCSHPSDNCFCTTMGGGPTPAEGFDISLIEIKNANEHYFVAELRSERALDLVDTSILKPTIQEQVTESEKLMNTASLRMKKRFNANQISTDLRANLENNQWQEIASRCLSCANCTMVCPTCFCTSTEDITDITGDHTERWLRWDSCFNGDFSYIHGGKIRTESRSRYRQWMTHKLSNWYDQFGSSGCVGCGRCITWCPVGIDITEEAAKIQEQALTEINP